MGNDTHEPVPGRALVSRPRLVLGRRRRRYPLREVFVASLHQQMRDDWRDCPSSWGWSLGSRDCVFPSGVGQSSVRSTIYLLETPSHFNRSTIYLLETLSHFNRSTIYLLETLSHFNG
jgi:hypothetical protein